MVDEEAFEGGPTFVEICSPHFSVQYGISAIYHAHKSPYQMVQVIQAIPWGRCLILDGHMQSSENDEFVYHESLVHPVMMNHPNPKNIFVGGGGEGSTLREILRYTSVEKITMVDIDGECVDVCKRFLPNHHKGSFDDPRVELIIQDAKVYLENTTEKFDVMFFDLSDPVEGGPAKLLYTRKFYEMCAKRLKEKGILATQAGPSGILTGHQIFSPIHSTLRLVFSHTFASSVFIPSYNDCWGFVYASMSEEFNPTRSKKNEVIEKLSKIKGGNELKFLDGLSYKSIFLFPKSLREMLKKETRIITEETPLIIP